MPEFMSPLKAWESFYVIVGSAGAALTGLQFIVIVLGAEKGVIKPRAARAFGTPTIIHFCAVVLLSAILTAPWPSRRSVAAALGTCGMAGVVYLGLIFRHARRQTEYLPDLEDWIFHTVVPIASYAALLASALCLLRHAETALFSIAALTLVLLFTGIHNSWDSVVYIATGQHQDLSHRRP